MQIKAWLLILLAGAALIILLGLTSPRPAVDASLLEILAAPPDSELASGWQAGIIRRVAGSPADSPTAAWERLERASLTWQFLPLGTDVIVFLFLLASGFITAIWWRAGRKFLPWVVGGVVAVWLLAGIWQRPGWSFPWDAGKDVLALPTQLLEAHGRALEVEECGSLWMSPAARRWFPQMGVKIPEDANPEVVAQAGNPVLWRAAARDDNVGAVLLVGDVAEYRPLLDFLLASPGWQLSAVEPSSVVFFRRDCAPLSTGDPWPDENTINERYADEGVRAAYLARLATMMTELGLHGEARRTFRQAVELGPQRADVRSLHASFLAQRGQWAEAIAEARAVLEDSPRFIPAWQVLVQAELAAERPENAWRAARQLLRLQPRDSYAIFLHARAANAAGASYAETESLRRLIRITDSLGLSSSGYRVLLGKSLAKQGLVEQARQEFETTLQAGDLDGEQRQQVEEFISRLDEASGG